ncbi:type II secretion system F family protein [Candidatus Woesearchaeota archaeon]|nr:type II secretion system F family protein [Candidatus Woesearchaeota archaeon]MBI2130687.1 type II secretion system F family protein [Candidatus Woesearchaeota archaeon]MBI2660882.1 type II secretion system F family protein [Candidatus Woesearchaeota archaeon]
MAGILFQKIAKSAPYLKPKLKQAGLNYSPEEFIKRTFLSAFYLTTGTVVFIFLVLSKLNLLKGVLFIVPPIIFFAMFSYMMRLPDIKISKREKEISREVVFAGRFLVIELESGISLYDAMVNVAKNYEVIGAYFREITDKISLGTSMEDALNEAVEVVPSDDFRKILWQIINSIRTGSNIDKSLNSVLDQITKDQQIKVNQYGKKLTPLSMFYMIISVILPSLGVTMLVIMSSFLKFQLNLAVLLLLASMIGVVQFMFISLVKFSRPAVEF